MRQMNQDWKTIAEDLLSGDPSRMVGKPTDQEAALLKVLVELFSASPVPPEDGTATVGRADAMFWAGIGATSALMGALARSSVDMGQAYAVITLLFPDDAPAAKVGGI